MFDSMPIKALCKISAVKRFGNDLNFMIDFNVKIAKMSQFIHICEFFRGRSVKPNKFKMSNLLQFRIQSLINLK